MTPQIHQPEIERKVLCCLMHIGNHRNSRLQEAMIKLQCDCFYGQIHAQIFSIIRDTFNRQEPFDLVEVMAKIPREDNDLYLAFMQLMEEYSKYFASDRSMEHDIDQLLTLRTLRKQIGIAEEMIQEVKNISHPDTARNRVTEYINAMSSFSFKESKDGAGNIEIAEDYYEGKFVNDLVIPTTCDQLNDALGGGVKAKSLITVAAGAGVGKTGWGIWLMDAIARNQPENQSLFFSLEMEARHIWMRHVGVCGGQQFEQMNEDQKHEAITKSVMVPFRIYDSATTRMASDIDYILTTARLKAMERPISVIVVDYLGLVQSRGTYESNALKQTDITSKLSMLAMELNCVVIALSQINRSSSSRAKDDRCPYPDDASGSSGSYFSSTLWIGVDRPELYQDCPSYRNQFVIKCRKNRFGGSFEMIMAFNDGTFEEVQNGFFPKPDTQSKKSGHAPFSERYKDY